MPIQARLVRHPAKERHAESLAKLGLVDEYCLLVHPVALGEDLGLFSGLSKPIELKLVSATPFPSGAVAQVYRP